VCFREKWQVSQIFSSFVEISKNLVCATKQIPTVSGFETKPEKAPPPPSSQLFFFFVFSCCHGSKSIKFPRFRRE
jgi:hypothetical protein